MDFLSNFGVMGLQANPDPPFERRGFRLTNPQRPAPIPKINQAGGAVATGKGGCRSTGWLLTEIWKSEYTEIETGEPLPVAFHRSACEDVSERSSSTDDDTRLQEIARAIEKKNFNAWAENARRLRIMAEKSPDDPGLKIMRATHLQTKYVLFGHELFRNRIDDRTADEDMIEALVLEALPYIRTVPEQAILAGKLLYFLQRGYDDMAVALTEDALRLSVVPANSLSIVGQMRSFRGETENALQLINQAISFSKPGSDAHLYALVIRCQALVAIGDYAAVALAKRDLYRASPAAMVFFELIYADPEALSFRAKLMARLFSRDQARGRLLWIWYCSARLFVDPRHGRNVLMTPVHLLRRRFGDAIVPDEVAATISGVG